MLGGKKTIIHFHGLVVSELSLYRFKWARKRFHAAYYVFCANHIKTSFRTQYPSIPESHLQVIYNGVDTEKFKSCKDHCKQNPVRFSFHGRWAQEKGVDYLLEAIHILEKKGCDFECFIAGSGSVGLSPEALEYTRKINSLSVDLKTVYFPGPIVYDQLPQFLNGMDFAVVPSIYAEPFGLTAIENMACGLPVVAFDIGGLRESIVEGKTGFLVENRRSDLLANAIEKLIGNSDLRNWMAINARKRVEDNFTWEKHCDQLEIIYKKIAANNNS